MTSVTCALLLQVIDLAVRVVSVLLVIRVVISSSELKRA